MANVNRNQDVFETESGKYVMSLAVKVSHLEKKIVKKASSKELLEFYNRVYSVCEDFKKNVIALETEERKNG